VARRLLGKEKVDLIQLASTLSRRRASRSRFGAPRTQYVTQDWADMKKVAVLGAGPREDGDLADIGLIVMVAALNIVASLILLVMEKHRDIGILKTMGASANSVTTIFMMQGLIIGLVGTLVGASAATPSTVLTRYQLLKVPADVYQMSTLPFRVLPLDFAFVSSRDPGLLHRDDLSSRQAASSILSSSEIPNRDGLSCVFVVTAHHDAVFRGRGSSRVPVAVSR